LPSRSTSTVGPPAGSLPRPAHVLIVVLENHAFDQIVASSDAPFLNSLVGRGALLTNSFAITHPSQPNYLALFSGSTQGVSDDSCPQTFSAPNLGRSLLDAGFTFTGYSEDLPAVGYQGCSAGQYARKHNPWSDFSNLPPSVNEPLSAFPADFAQLPTVSFLIPNEAHDMHSGTVAAADTWLSRQLGPYADWAAAHNSLLILTTDEDDYSASNHIATLLVGAHLRSGRYPQRIDHYGLLHTIEAMYGLPLLGHSAGSALITDVWNA
jgi:acid phosphatase